MIPKRLIECHDGYRAAKASRPYDFNGVQAWGLAFAYHYRLAEEAIRSIVDITDEEWDNYSNHDWIMDCARGPVIT